MKKIQLTQNKVALVDDCDYDALSKYTWSASKCGKTFYATRHPSMVKGVRGSNIIMHRVVMDTPKGVMVDHINHNGLDNRRKNLRPCNNKQNQENMMLPKTNTSGYRGVRWHKHAKKWYAQIKHDGKQIHIGSFTNKIDAVLARTMKEKELFTFKGHKNASSSN